MKKAVKVILVSLFMLVSAVKVYANNELFKSHVLTSETLDKHPHINSAYQAQRRGNFSKAMKLYKVAYVKADNREAAIRGFVHSAYKAKSKDDAVDFLTEIIEKNTFDIESRLLLSDVYHEDGQLDQALTQLNITEKLSSKDLRVAQRKAVIFHTTKKYDDAIKYYNDYIAGNANDWDMIRRRADCYFENGDADKALADVKQAYSLRPYDRNVLLSYLKVFKHKELFKDGEAVAKQCTNVHGDSVDCWNYCGDYAAALNKASESIDCYNKSISLAQNDAVVRRKIADVLSKSGNHNEADKQYAHALRLNVADEDTMRVWTKTLTARQKFDLLGEKLQVFHKNNPNNVWAAVEFSNLMTTVGRHDDAMDAMKVTMKASDSDVARMYYGHVLFQNQKYSKAEDVVEDIKDAKLNVNFNLGNTYYAMEKWEKAAKHYEKVAAESPSHHKALINRSLAMAKDGKISVATEILNSTTFPQEMADVVTKQIQFLNDAQVREPSSKKSDLVVDGIMKPYLDWELPGL